jgi:hypothetical protein
MRRGPALLSELAGIMIVMLPLELYRNRALPMLEEIYTKGYRNGYAKAKEDTHTTYNRAYDKGYRAGRTNTK